MRGILHSPKIQLGVHPYSQETLSDATPGMLWWGYGRRYGKCGLGKIGPVKSSKDGMKKISNSGICEE